MIKFPFSSVDWYVKRDNRTNAVEGIGGFEKFSLGIMVDPAVKLQPKIQAMALICLNLCSRWCRNIILDMPSECPDLLFKRGKTFNSCLRETASDADPHIQILTGNIDEKKIDGLLVIGNLATIPTESYTWINCDGWLAGVGLGPTNYGLSVDGSKNILGAAMAACLGVAALFRRANGIVETQPYSVWHSLYDFKANRTPEGLHNPSIKEDIDFGNIFQIGCGAVGSSLDYLLSLTEWSGRLHLIDYDRVDYPDCNRSLMFSAYDAVNQKYKTEVCYERLQDKFETFRHEFSYSDFIERLGEKTSIPDLILCLANEQNVWPTIQHNFPPVVLHATTTRNWGINFGRHLPLKEWCILCRFAEEFSKQHNFTPPCSESIINDSRFTQEPKQILGVLPFLSAASAAMIAAEIAKLNMEESLSRNNFGQFSFRNPAENFIAIHQSKKEDCLCNTQQLEIYERFRENGKYWKKEAIK